MSVKKSRATGKSTSVRRPGSTNQDAVTTTKTEEIRDAATPEKVTQDEAARNLSSRASRKVAAEKGAGESSVSNDASQCSSMSQNEADSVHYFPSRRVWPD